MLFTSLKALVFFFPLFLKTFHAPASNEGIFSFPAGISNKKPETTEKKPQTPVHVGPVLDRAQRKIPTPPPDYLEKCRGRLCFRYPGSLADQADALANKSHRLEIENINILGSHPPPKTIVSLSATRSQFHALLPEGTNIPAWAAAVAFPRIYYIVMGPSGTDSLSARFALLAHEYSHISLAYTTGFRRLPTWFVEGVADLTAGRTDPLAMEFSPSTLSLNELERGFPRSHRKASAAYSQSRSFVFFLYSSGSPQDFHSLIHLLRRGDPFHKAVKEIYGVSLEAMENRWLRDWRYRKLVVPLITSGLIIWILAALLLVLGYMKKRRSQKIKLSSMPDDAEFMISSHPPEAVLLRNEKKQDYRPSLIWFLAGLGMTFLASGLLRPIFPNTRTFAIFAITGAVIGILMALPWWMKGRSSEEEKLESPDDDG